MCNFVQVRNLKMKILSLLLRTLHTSPHTLSLITYQNLIVSSSCILLDVFTLEFLTTNIHLCIDVMIDYAE